MDFVEEIEKNGTPITWTETRYDRDGWEYTANVSGYKYKKHRYIIRYDRDGWPEVSERDE